MGRVFMIELFPAIDLLDGKAVRLHQGRYDSVTVYGDDPLARARSFRDAGARWLHVVDLAGAKAGKCVQAALVREIVKAFGGQVEVGGGVRTRDAFESYLDAGATRVVLGTAAVRDPSLVRAMCIAYPGHVVLAVDAKDGMVATDGWETTETVTAVDLAKSFADMHVGAVLYTDVSRDGTQVGPNVPATARLARESGLPVLASGGVGTLAHLRELATHPEISGVIVGRAIYEKIFTVEEALLALREKDD
ncbi:1-(5-phosphoribosyl)-5-[(5-phosphoribosylamino)methylideneamino]imidazole-4-carboxamide isomerase [soil metagenome]